MGSLFFKDVTKHSFLDGASEALLPALGLAQ